MTKEEAIKILSNRDMHGMPCGYTNGYTEALDRAIEALKAQEWVPCGEKLPQYRKPVLVSTYWGVRIAERDAVQENGTDDFWYLFLDDATAKPRYVYAWMPLPPDYEGK